VTVELDRANWIRMGDYNSLGSARAAFRLHNRVTADRQEVGETSFWMVSPRQPMTSETFRKLLLLAL
jgi:hypothetical protein